jgi:hypothetical protein
MAALARVVEVVPEELGAKSVLGDGNHHQGDQ